MTLIVVQNNVVYVDKVLSFDQWRGHVDKRVKNELFVWASAGDVSAAGVVVQLLKTHMNLGHSIETFCDDHDSHRDASVVIRYNGDLFCYDRCTHGYFIPIDCSGPSGLDYVSGSGQSLFLAYFARAVAPTITDAFEFVARWIPDRSVSAEFDQM